MPFLFLSLASRGSALKTSASPWILHISARTQANRLFLRLKQSLDFVSCQAWLLLSGLCHRIVSLKQGADHYFFHFAQDQAITPNQGKNESVKLNGTHHFLIYAIVLIYQIKTQIS
jgi:hypothetical protein